jgi:hypothetical protein
MSEYTIGFPDPLRMALADELQMFAERLRTRTPEAALGAGFLGRDPAGSA